MLTFIGVLCNAAAYFAGPKDLVLIFATHIIGSIPLAAIFPLMGSMYADTADYGEWKFGRRATGLIFAGSACAQKSGGAIGGASSTWCSPSSATRLTLPPVGGCAGRPAQPHDHATGRVWSGGDRPIVFYRLNPEKEQQIAAELAERKRRGPAGARGIAPA